MQCDKVPGGPSGNALIIISAKNIFRSGGFAAYYRGLGMGLVGIAPYAALDLGTFHLLKTWLAGRKAKKLGCHESDVKSGNFSTACLGGFTGAFGASVVYPLNVMRTRLQAQGSTQHPQTYTGWADVFHKTVRYEGYRGLYKGLTPNLVKVVPAVSITYVVYENAKNFMALK
jgi:solute carrier family 25 phosphate transporter 23/24/25/41